MAQVSEELLGHVFDIRSLWDVHHDDAAILEFRGEGVYATSQVVSCIHRAPPHTPKQSAGPAV